MSITVRDIMELNLLRDSEIIELNGAVCKIYSCYFPV